MPCEECRDLSSHAFRSADDLVHALRLAAEEMNRGVLARDDGVVLRDSEREALQSSIESGALPPRLSYRFRCNVCGDRFVLDADPATGEGGWAREGDEVRPTAAALPPVP